MASTETGELKLETTDVKTAPGVDLSSEQRTLVASVLDLFAGRPSLAKLQLWKDDGEFSDPITMAKGRKQYEAQWVSALWGPGDLRKHFSAILTNGIQYGLQTAFSEIERKSHNVTSAGNPISMDLTTRYKVKGVGKETTINSKINIFTDGGKIQRVEDKWDGKLPDSSITNVCNRWLNVVSPFFWTHYVFGWFYSAIVLLHETPLARVRGLRGFLAELLLHALICQHCVSSIFAGPHANTVTAGLPQAQRRLRPENGRRAQQRRRRREARQLAAAQE